MRNRRFLGKPDSGGWAARDQMMTASDCGAILGMLPEKWGRNRSTVIQGKLAGGEWRQTRRMWWGTEDEADNLRKLGLMSGLRSRPHHGFYSHADFPLVGATTDGLLVRPLGWSPDPFLGHVNLIGVAERMHDLAGEQLQLVAGHPGRLGLAELKLTEGDFAKEWDNGPPEWYEAQVQLQLLCTELPWALLAARIGSADMRWWFVGFDESRARMYAAEMQAAANELAALRKGQ